MNLLTGCATKNDAISQAEKNEKDRARHRRDQGDRRGRVHLRPADRDELRGDVRVLPSTRTRANTRRRSIRSSTRPVSSPTRTRPSSHPTATRPIRCSGWTCAPSRSCSRCRRWKKSATTRCMLCDGNTYNYGYIGSRATGNEAGRLSGRRPGLEGRDAGRHQESIPFHHAVRAGGLPHPALQRGRHAERGQGAVRLQGAAALGLPEATRAARRAGDQFPAD